MFTLENRLVSLFATQVAEKTSQPWQMFHFEYGPLSRTRSLSGRFLCTLLHHDHLYMIATFMESPSAMILTGNLKIWTIYT